MQSDRNLNHQNNNQLQLQNGQNHLYPYLPTQSPIPYTDPNAHVSPYYNPNPNGKYSVLMTEDFMRELTQDQS